MPRYCLFLNELLVQKIFLFCHCNDKYSCWMIHKMLIDINVSNTLFQCVDDCFKDTGGNYTYSYVALLCSLTGVSLFNVTLS